MYVIQRTDRSGGFVTRPGSIHSYTPFLQHAQVFGSREEAERHRCVGNEIVVDLHSFFPQSR